MLKIHDIDMTRRITNPIDELWEMRSYIYQLVEELKYGVDFGGSVTNIINNENNVIKDDTNIFLASHPVGSVYICVADEDPHTYGGTWERIKDTFLLAAGDTYTNGSTGGEATHKLTAAESGLPAHTHSAKEYVVKTASTGTVKWHPAPKADSTSSYSNSVEVESNTAADAKNAHNNMPPYIAVNVWKRTA